MMHAILLMACSASSPLPFVLAEVARIENPTAIVGLPQGGLLVLEQEGRLYRVDEKGSVVVLDIRGQIKAGGETGLLGAALARSFPADPRIFLNYTVLEGKQLKTRVVSVRATEQAEVIAGSEVLLIGFDQPYSNHNGGGLAVAPDGTLFISVGDGGSAGDPKATGQNPGDLLGSILRIDPTPSGGLAYTIPADNPFVGRAGYREEVWAYGVRNPWGMHFDGETLYFADVGQDDWEEVNRGVKGGNYGWNVMEGMHCFKNAGCSSKDMIPPLAEYGHGEGRSVTGGVVYRGPSIPVLDGRYVYADFVTGVLWALPVGGGDAVKVADTELLVSSFGRDRRGRLYIGDYKGVVYRVDPK